MSSAEEFKVWISMLTKMMSFLLWAVSCTYPGSAVLRGSLDSSMWIVGTSLTTTSGSSSSNCGSQNSSTLQVIDMYYILHFRSILLFFSLCWSTCEKKRVEVTQTFHLYTLLQTVHTTILNDTLSFRPCITNFILFIFLLQAQTVHVVPWFSRKEDTRYVYICEQFTEAWMISSSPKHPDQLWIPPLPASYFLGTCA